MKYRMTVIYEDKEQQHTYDENWNQVGSISHFLETKKLWESIVVTSVTEAHIAVNFRNGVFVLNGKPTVALGKDGEILSHKTDTFDFQVSNEWKHLTALPYFPVVGIRHIVSHGSHRGSHHIVPFIGWKRRENNTTIKRVAYLFPSGYVGLT